MFCNWGVLGPGFVATQAVIPAIQASRNGRVRALASRDLARAEKLARYWNIEKVYGDYQDLLADPQIDAVYIALPNHLHCAWTLHAARAGKHVLCEKPLACTAHEGEQMHAACQSAGVQLMEAAMYRFHPRTSRLRQLVREGHLGDLRLLHSSFTFTLSTAPNYRHVALYGGGALLDVGCYCVNALCYFSGTTPIEIQALVSRREASGIDLAVSALLRFSSGARGHMQCSFEAAEHQSIELIGSEGAVTMPLAFTAWHNDATVLHFQHGQERSSEEFAPADPYKMMVEHFVAALSGEESLAYTPQEAIHILQVLDTIRARWSL